MKKMGDEFPFCLRSTWCEINMLHSDRMQGDPPGDSEFRLESPVTAPADGGWPSALLFETPVQIYQRVYRVLRPRSATPAVEVRFEQFVNADSSIRFDNGRLLVRVTDLLEGAPSPIHEALAYLLLGKMLRKQIPKIYAYRYRLFLNRREMRKRAQVFRQERGRKIYRPAKGNHYDLEEIFDELNVAHFHGLMAKPKLGWSAQRSRTRLAHFDPSHNVIVVSAIFDRLQVPRLALEYVMFHEMLHLQFPVEIRGPRRCVHTRAFQQAERRFPGFLEAQEMLKKL